MTKTDGKTQINKLLDYLSSEKNRWIPSSLLSDYLRVSTRQVRKYVSTVNNMSDQPLIISGSDGYKLDIDAYEKYRWVNKSNYETPDRRQNYIIQKLVELKNGVDVHDLADELYVSDTTIENDLIEVSKALIVDNLSITRSKNAIKLSGEEIHKRRLMSRLISSDSYDNFALKDEVRMLTFHYHFWGFRTELRSIFAENDIFANDYTLNNTALHLIIMIDRIRNHCELQEHVNIEKIKVLPQYRVSLKIKEFLEKTYDIVINDAELYNLTLIIDSNTTMINYSSVNAENLNDFIEEKYVAIADHVISNVEKVYYLDPFDADFKAKFTIHIKNLFQRAEQHYFIKNPLTGKIKSTYPLIYDIAVFIAQDLKKTYRLEITEDEITFIALHIGAYFENNVQSKTKVSIAFIYADYYSIHKASIERISKEFGDRVLMKYVISVNDFRPSFIHADLIVSSVDMPFSNEYVTIHPFLTSDDIESIRIAIKKIASAKRNRALKDMLMNFFNPKLFYINPQISSKEDALRFMSSEAISLGVAEDGFYESIMDRERASSTVFGEVAVPHSLERKSNQSFICVAISDRPIRWDNTNIHMIMMIGLNEDSRKIFSEVFDKLINIISEPSNVCILAKSSSFVDFIAKIKEFIDHSE